MVQHIHDLTPTTSFLFDSFKDVNKIILKIEKVHRKIISKNYLYYWNQVDNYSDFFFATNVALDSSLRASIGSPAHR